MIRSVLDGLAMPVLLGVLGKVTLLLVLGFALAALLRRRSAALRHLAWLLTLAGALALAAITPIAPTLPVPVLAPATTPSSNAALETGRHDSAPGFPARNLAPAVAPDRAPGSIRPGFPRPMSAGAVAIALWALGFAVVLSWCGLGHLGLARLARRAVPLDGTPHREIAQAARAGLAAGSETRIALSSHVGAPVTWGWRRAVILLPDAARAWPAQRVRVALRHELAHVARGDYLAQLLATLACAAFWFHPLVWMAAHRMRSESEHACDDLVLGDGTPAPDYASHLLEVARGERGLRLAGLVAIGMARRSHLEGRLLAVLDEHRRRHVVSARARTVLIALLTCALVPLAGLRLTASTASTASKTTAATQKVTPKPTSDETQKPDQQVSDGDGNATLQRTYDVSPGGHLYLDLDTGGDIILRGSSENKVVVRAHLAGKDWRDTRVAVEKVSDGVRVRSTFASGSWVRSTSHRFEIQVPRRYDLEVRSAGGGLDLQDVEGDFHGETGGGDLTFQHLKGHARISTGGGDIHVTDCELSGGVSTGGGAVRLSRVRGGLRGSSGSGPVVYSESKDSGEDSGTGDLVNLRVDQSHGRIANAGSGARGMLNIEKAGGDVDLDEAPEGARITTGGGDVRVGRAAGIVEVHTGGGDIKVGPVAGSVGAGTGAGTVHVILADPKGRDQNVEIQSGTGKVILELPANLDATFEIETAFTQEFGRETQIRSDFPLEREVTSGWDNGEGTPRRYVRGRGVAGKGRGAIRVRTVNGDVEVRRVP